jgi:predicted lipoprotein
VSTVTTKPPTNPGRPARRPASKQRGRIITAAVVVLVVVAAALSTKVVANDSELLVGPAAFDAATYGEEQFPEVVAYVAENAVDAAELATALQSDPTAATQYGVASSSGIGAVVPVSFTGTVGPADQTGLPIVTVPGVPEGFLVHVQFGPAINGTDLRDASGEVSLNDFENQIQYQDAGAALNDQVKAQVLAPLAGQDLNGATVAVEGVVTLINPQSWNVTPTSIEVQ